VIAVNAASVGGVNRRTNNRKKNAYKKIGIIYDKSSAIAVSAKIAFAAIGLARSSRPGIILITVENQIARRGVCVKRELWLKKPLSGRPAYIN